MPMTLWQRRGLYLAWVLLAVFFLGPMVWSIANSFKPAAAALADPVSLFSDRFSLENYGRLQTVGAGWHVYATNSVLIAFGTVALTLLIAVPAGYGFSKFKFPGQLALFVVVMATLMIPFQSILTPLFLILSALKLQNSLVGLILVYVTLQLPFSVFMMRNAFDAVPREIEEAARVDGASVWLVLVKVMLPLVFPGVVTVAIFAFLNSWNEFLAALIFMTDQDKYTLPILMTAVASGQFGTINWGAIQSGVTVMMLPCLALFLLLQRYYVRGLTAGAVK